MIQAWSDYLTGLRGGETWRRTSNRLANLGRLSLGRSHHGHGTIRNVTIVLWRTPEYTARGIFYSNMVLCLSTARALKIACRQNRCADNPLRRTRAVPFYLATLRQ